MKTDSLQMKLSPSPYCIILLFTLSALLATTFPGCATTAKESSQKNELRETTTSPYSREAKQLYEAAKIAFTHAKLAYALEDPESLSLVSKWHLFNPTLRHRFTIRVIVTHKSFRGSEASLSLKRKHEDISLYVRSQYQILEAGEWIDSFAKKSIERKLQKKAQKDEAKFAAEIKKVYQQLSEKR